MSRSLLPFEILAYLDRLVGEGKEFCSCQLLTSTAPGYGAQQGSGTSKAFLQDNKVGRDNPN